MGAIDATKFAAVPPGKEQPSLGSNALALFHCGAGRARNNEREVPGGKPTDDTKKNPPSDDPTRQLRCRCGQPKRGTSALPAAGQYPTRLRCPPGTRRSGRNGRAVGVRHLSLAAQGCRYGEYRRRRRRARRRAFAGRLGRSPDRVSGDLLGQRRQLAVAGEVPCVIGFYMRPLFRWSPIVVTTAPVHGGSARSGRFGEGGVGTKHAVQREQPQLTAAAPWCVVAVRGDPQCSGSQAHWGNGVAALATGMARRLDVGVGPDQRDRVQKSRPVAFASAGAALQTAASSGAWA